MLAPNQINQDYIIQQLYPGSTPVYNEDGSFDGIVTADGNRVKDPLGNNFDLTQAQQQYSNQSALNDGLIPLDVQSIQHGLDVYGLTPDQWAASYYGPGQIQTINGQTYYKKNDGTTSADTPWSFNLAAPDPAGAAVLGLALGGLGVPIAGALGGGLLGSVGAGAAVGGLGADLNGGNVLKGALGGALGGGLGTSLPSVGITNPAAIGAVRGATGALVNGSDPLTGALMGGVSGEASSLLPNIPVSPTQVADAGTVTSDAPPPEAGSMGNDSLAQNQADLNAFLKNIGPQTTQQALGIGFPIFPVAPSNQPQEAGGKKVSFFGDILGDPNAPDNYDLVGNPNAIGAYTPEQSWASSLGALNQDGSINWDAINSQIADPNSPIYMGSIDSGPTIPEASGFPTGSVLGLIKSLLGTGSGSSSTGGLLGNGGILGAGLSLGNAAAIAPSLAAINYARNQSPFDTSSLQGLSTKVPTAFNFDTSGINNVMNQVPTNFNVDTSPLTNLESQIPTSYNFDTSKLTDAYNQFDPNSVTGQYDLNTAAGRQGLTSSLASRGVAGSSFGNSDLTNYGMQRDVGRQELINNAITQKAGIANDILANDRAAAQLGLQGLGLQGQVANNLINAQQTANSQGLQALGLRGNLANSLLGAQQNQAQLGLQGQQLQRNIFGDILNANIAQQKNRNALYGSALSALAGGLRPTSPSLYGTA